VIKKRNKRKEKKNGKVQTLIEGARVGVDKRVEVGGKSDESKSNREVR
jgi:hypothetical protein